jgi:hypothetical protein
MIKNLAQLKRALNVGTEFMIVGHCRSEEVGKRRRVNYADTTGFYSIDPDAPDSKTTTANGGKGSFLGWRTAPFWGFGDDGICTLYSSNNEKSDKTLVIAIRVLN